MPMPLTCYSPGCVSLETRNRRDSDGRVRFYCGSHTQGEESPITVGSLTLHLFDRRAEANGQVWYPTFAEFCVLAQLMFTPERPVSHNLVRAYTQVLCRPCVIDSNCFRVIVARIRRKLETLAPDVQIGNVFGLGYAISTRPSVARAA